MFALQPIGAILGLCGLIWLLLDKYARGAAYLIFFGLVALIAGGALS